MGLAAPQHVESARTRDQTHVPCIGRQILNHWTQQGSPGIFFLKVPPPTLILESFLPTPLAAKEPECSVAPSFFITKSDANPLTGHTAKPIYLLYSCGEGKCSVCLLLDPEQGDGNTRPPDLPLEKPICRSGNNRTGHGTTDWFQIGKGVRQGCILLPCLFNLYAEHIMRNSGLEETQAGIKIARRNINNLRYGRK